MRFHAIAFLLLWSTACLAVPADGPGRGTGPGPTSGSARSGTTGAGSTSGGTTVSGGSTVSTGTSSSGGAPSVVITGPFAFDAQLANFDYPRQLGCCNPGDTSEVEIVFGENGGCMGVGGTGLSVVIDPYAPGGVVPGTYPLTNTELSTPYASFFENDWTSSSYGEVGALMDGGVTLTEVDSVVSGSFSANLMLDDGGIVTVAGTFSNVAECMPPGH